MQYITPEAQERRREDAHPSQRQHHIQPISSPLYVITAIFNPIRYYSRYKLYHGFEKHVRDSGAHLYTIEAALRDRHHETIGRNTELLDQLKPGSCSAGQQTSQGSKFEHEYGNSVQHIALRTESELWIKENLSNIAMMYLPRDWEYVAFVDADFLFTRPDWANETLHQLQHYDAVQMYSSLTYLNSRQRPVNHMDAFVWMHMQQGTYPKTYGHKGAVGGAWAFRRSAIEKLGGLLDTCILGSGDWHMAFALALREDSHPEMKYREIPGYVKAINDWSTRAAGLKGNIGYVECHAIHHWHGPMNKRGYGHRPAILKRNAFDPYVDMHKDHQGLWRLAGNKPRLRDEIRAYFRQRNEDQLAED